MRANRRLCVVSTFFILLVIAFLFRDRLNPIMTLIVTRLTGGHTTSDRMAEFGSQARERMRPAFVGSNVSYPPSHVVLLGIKSERFLHVFAGPSHEVLSPITTYTVLGQSGELGPKLREGDRQVPEGIYRIEGLNPNSSFHVSMKLNYPNGWDTVHAKAEERTNPGTNIFIHGNRASVGCLAMGDEVIEELFTLVADVGKENVRVIISPVDFRQSAQAFELPDGPIWLPALYKKIEAAVQAL